MRMISSTALKKISHFLLSTSLPLFSVNSFAATGDPLPGLTANELAYFEAGKELFGEDEAVPDGLGPTFNGTSCGGCHSHPAVGGSSGPVNPQFDMATALGARNIVPGFITKNGPIREARFRRNPDGTPDGGVHGLFVITGRSDAGSCNIRQPDFAGEARRNNLSLRTSSPTFGGGLIESIPDASILANQNANAARKKQLGIKGHVNRNDNDGTITRFGWKAQNKSLTIFAGEAYNVEQGITSELFPTKRDESENCTVNGTPEDHIQFEETTPIAAMNDIIMFSTFMRFLAPPEPLPLTPRAQEGQRIFDQIGCALCHTPTFKTGKSSTEALSQKDVNLYSDLLVHHMGKKLDEGLRQGTADTDEFRTAPLWGLKDRLFFLHDGRTNDLTQAILEHSDSGRPDSFDAQRSEDGKPDPKPKPDKGKSEANEVIKNFERLSQDDKAKLLEFLKSL